MKYWDEAALKKAIARTVFALLFSFQLVTLAFASPRLTSSPPENVDGKHSPPVERADDPSEFDAAGFDRRLTSLEITFSAIQTGEAQLTQLTERISFFFAGLSVVVLMFQIYSFNFQNSRERDLHSKLMTVMDIASAAAQEASAKANALEEGGLDKAAHTLSLINSLLEVTARTALRASETEHNILEREISNKDEECRELIAESLKDEERAIIARVCTHIEH